MTPEADIPALSAAELAWFDQQLPLAFHGAAYLRAKYAELIKQEGHEKARTAMLTMLRNSGVFGHDELIAITTALFEALIVQREAYRAAVRFADHPGSAEFDLLLDMVAVARASSEGQV